MPCMTIKTTFLHETLNTYKYGIKQCEICPCNAAALVNQGDILMSDDDLVHVEQHRGALC